MGSCPTASRRPDWHVHPQPPRPRPEFAGYLIKACLSPRPGACAPLVLDASPAQGTNFIGGNQDWISAWGGGRTGEVGLNLSLLHRFPPRSAAIVYLEYLSTCPLIVLDTAYTLSVPMKAFHMAATFIILLGACVPRTSAHPARPRR